MSSMPRLKRLTGVEPGEIRIKAGNKTYPGSTPPDGETFGPHGIDPGARKGDVIALYAVNHGGRESVEAFENDVYSDFPCFTWVGCVVVPDDGWPDAVVWLSNSGGFVATAMVGHRGRRICRKSSFLGRHDLQEQNPP